MPTTLDRLPFDILFYISSHLRFDDILSLGHTCRLLKAILHENTLCRRVIEVLILRLEARVDYDGLIKGSLTSPIPKKPSKLKSNKSPIVTH
jgi:hypothetical protein